MANLFWLNDDAWATIEPHLPKNQPGARRVDDRRIISGIIHVLNSTFRISRGVAESLGESSEEAGGDFHGFRILPGHP